MRVPACLGAAALAAALAVLAPAVPRAEAERTCAFDAYVIDADPKGTNIRAAPSGQAKVVAVVKSANEIQVAIVAERGGWFRIRQFSDFSTGKDTAVEGWIHGSVLGADLMIMQGAKASERLREEPSDRSKTLLVLQWDPGADGQLQRLTAELPGGKQAVIDFARIKHAVTAIPLACTADWIKIRVHTYSGWVPKNRLCGNPVTTCN